MKRMIKWASDEGFDSIAWTTGKQQAARYDLSKHIKAINAEKIDSGVGDPLSYSWKLEIVPHNAGTGSNYQETVYSAKDDLSDYVGKELADKIEKNKGGMFKDLDLEVGGEGMAGFYDKILVDQANKIGKKHGAKVEKGSIGTSEMIDSYQDQINKLQKRLDEGNLSQRMRENYQRSIESHKKRILEEREEAEKVWTMKLTDKLKEAAKEGLPYYALVPPGLLAVGAQRERQSLLE
jgi:hypothetical protein